MSAITLKLGIKSNGRQYSLRAKPPDTAGLWSALPELRKAIEARRGWQEKVHVLWNGIPRYFSTLGYYPDSGYVELGINEGNPVHNFAEKWDLAGQPATFFRAEYASGSRGMVAKLNLISLP